MGPRAYTIYKAVSPEDTTTKSRRHRYVSMDIILLRPTQSTGISYAGGLDGAIFGQKTNQQMA